MGDTLRQWWPQLLFHPVQKPVTLFIFNDMNEAFKPLALLGDDLWFVYALLAQASFQRLAG